MSAAADLNPYSHLKAAAEGDLKALHALTGAGLALAVNDHDEWGLIEALMFARLAYAKSGAEAEAGLLLSTLAIAAELARECDDTNAQATWQGEHLAITSLLAERGVAIADQFLPALADQCLPEALGLAKQFQKMMQGE